MSWDTVGTLHCGWEASGSGDIILLAADGLVFDVSSARLWHETRSVHWNGRWLCVCVCWEALGTGSQVVRALLLIGLCQDSSSIFVNYSDAAVLLAVWLAWL